MSSNGIFYPNVTTIPGQSGIAQPDAGRSRRSEAGQDVREFERIFDQALEKVDSGEDLGRIQTPLKFSAHATQRLRDRNISIDPNTMNKVRDAVQKAEAKGVEDTLILTPQAALIVNVRNKTVVTALDRGALTGNVFTNIDGAVIV